MPLICFKSQATTIIPPSLAYMTADSGWYPQSKMSLRDESGLIQRSLLTIWARSVAVAVGDRQDHSLMPGSTTFSTNAVHHTCNQGFVHASGLIQLGRCSPSGVAYHHRFDARSAVATKAFTLLDRRPFFRSVSRFSSTKPGHLGRRYTASTLSITSSKEHPGSARTPRTFMADQRLRRWKRTWN